MLRCKPVSGTETSIAGHDLAVADPAWASATWALTEPFRHEAQVVHEVGFASCCSQSDRAKHAAAIAFDASVAACAVAASEIVVFEDSAAEASS